MSLLAEHLLTHAIGHDDCRTHSFKYPNGKPGKLELYTGVSTMHGQLDCEPPANNAHFVLVVSSHNGSRELFVLPVDHSAEPSEPEFDGLPQFLNGARVFVVAHSEDGAKETIAGLEARYRKKPVFIQPENALCVEAVLAANSTQISWRNVKAADAFGSASVLPAAVLCEA